MALFGLKARLELCPEVLPTDTEKSPPRGALAQIVFISAALGSDYFNINLQARWKNHQFHIDLQQSTMKLSTIFLAMTGANAINYRRLSDDGMDNAFADALPRFGRDLTGWNRGRNGAINVNRAFDNTREQRVPGVQNYLEFMIESGKLEAEEIIAAIEAVRERAQRQRRRAPIRMRY